MQCSEPAGAPGLPSALPPSLPSISPSLLHAESGPAHLSGGAQERKKASSRPLSLLGGEFQLGRTGTGTASVAA